MTELTAIEDLPDETRRIALKTMQFREGNIEKMQNIERLGGAVEVDGARLEHLLASLVALGIITEQAMWEINLDWEKKLRPQLIGALEPLREQHRRSNAIRKLVGE